MPIQQIQGIHSSKGQCKLIFLLAVDAVENLLKMQYGSGHAATAFTYPSLSILHQHLVVIVKVIVLMGTRRCDSLPSKNKI